MKLEIPRRNYPKLCLYVFRSFCRILVYNRQGYMITEVFLWPRVTFWRSRRSF
jgi:hypothetical protein